MSKAIPSYQIAIQNKIRDLSLGFPLTSFIHFKSYVYVAFATSKVISGTFTRFPELPRHHRKNKNLHKRKVSEIGRVLKR